MNPLILLAELIAHGVTVERRNGQWSYIGVDDPSSLGTLGDELNAHHRDLEHLLEDREGTEHAR